MNQYIEFKVKKCVKLDTEPQTEWDYWSADVKIVLCGHVELKFKNIIFSEKPGEYALIAGIENKEGIHENFWPADATRQAGFIQFLRAASASDQPFMVGALDLSSATEYGAMEGVTAAYMAARALTHPFCVGRTEQDGKHEWVVV